MEKPGTPTLTVSEKPWSSNKKGSRKLSPMFYCWICIFACLFIILVCPGFDPLDRTYGSSEHIPYREGETLDICRGRRVYVYDLPPEFNTVVHNESMCKYFLMQWIDLCPRFANRGYGLKLWNESDLKLTDDFDNSNWFDTDSYMLEMIFHSRMQNYRCRTTDRSKADALFVPFYAGLLALEHLYEMPNLEPTYEKRKRFGVELIDWLEKNGGEALRRHGGRDHFLILGRTTWDFRLYRFWGNGFSELPYVENMTKLLLERDPREGTEQAIPYPTSFHPESPQRLSRWIDGVKSADRKHLFSYVGGVRPDNLSVRGLISSACLNAGKSLCHFVNCSVVICSHDPVSTYKAFLQSDFCLQPRGDSATRRSTFDCLISGTIPVFFDEDSAYTQYSWHLPKEPDQYSVFIAEEDIRKGVSIVDILLSYSAERVSEMRRTIIATIPNLLYNDYANDPWSPSKDALELSIARVLERIAAAKEQRMSRSI